LCALVLRADGLSLPHDLLLDHPALTLQGQPLPLLHLVLEHRALTLETLARQLLLTPKLVLKGLVLSVERLLLLTARERLVERYVDHAVWESGSPGCSGCTEWTHRHRFAPLFGTQAPDGHAYVVSSLQAKLFSGTPRTVSECRSRQCHPGRCNQAAV
jgi:hypothetical protein